MGEQAPPASSQGQAVLTGAEAGGRRQRVPLLSGVPSSPYAEQVEELLMWSL